MLSEREILELEEIEVQLLNAKLRRLNNKRKNPFIPNSKRSFKSGTFCGALMVERNLIEGQYTRVKNKRRFTSKPKFLVKREFVQSLAGEAEAGGIVTIKVSDREYLYR
jgi:hypothetical protein